MLKNISAAILVENQKIEVSIITLPKIQLDEFEISILRAGICSSDVQRGMNNGAYHYPLIMGHELSGVISKIGNPMEDDFSIGDKVSIFPLLPCFKCSSCKEKMYALCTDYNYYGSRCNGGFSEKLIVKKWNLKKIPSNVSLENGALLEPMAVVLHAIDKMEIDKNDKINICILGAGFLGLLALQILNFKFPKCKLTIVDRNEFKLKIAQKFSGTTKLFKSKKYLNEFLINKGNSFDGIFEFVGNSETFLASINLCKQNGKIVWVGNPIDDLNLPQKLVSSILRKEISLLGSWNSLYKSKKKCDWENALSLISEGINPASLISKKIKLDEIQTTLKSMSDHKLRIKKYNIIKVMLEFK